MKLMIDVVAGIIQKEGKFLLARRKPGSHLEGFWEFPGGKVEAGETPELSLVRELAEELSISTRTGAFLAESVHDYGDKQVRLMAFFSTYLGGDLILESHDKVQWVSVDEIESFLLAPADIPLVLALKKCFEQT